MEEADLWVKVIEQALWDATLGASQFGRKRLYIEPKGTSNGFHVSDITEAREFISGKTGALKDICQTLGLEYLEVKEMLNKKYEECMKKLPEKWRQPLETIQHNGV